MRRASRDRDDTAREPRHIHRRKSIRRSAITELPAYVVPPALETTCSGQRTTVRPAHRDRDNAGVEPTNGCRLSDGSRGTVTDLSPLVETPTLDAADPRQGTRVQVAATDLPAVHTRWLADRASRIKGNSSGIHKVNKSIDKARRT
jgi:hypothetical protein